ncbi:MAG: AMMECR1 domain-containing protein, partial [Desulfovibrio sp.]|nr:AMMECR1 domain-containing protein [Desulfovibrio sp.]
LPQVPVEQGWAVGQYLDNLCLKAGVAPGSWKKPGAELFWYQALVFPARRA